MSSENRPGFNDEIVLTLGVAVLAILLLAMCVVSFLLINRMREPTAVAQQEAPATSVPAALVSTAVPVNYTFVRLPVVLTEPQTEPVSVPVTESQPVTEQVWRVTGVVDLGYALNGAYYDLGTFTRIDGLETTQAYCLNAGWDSPAIGTQYSLSPEGIFVPLQEPSGDPLQRFQRLIVK